jgi:ankyrin repeat protein
MKCWWGVLKKAIVSVAACLVGLLALLILLMVIGSLREARMHKGVPDFIDAAATGDYVRLKAMVSKDPKLICTRDECGETALMRVARNGDRSIADFLISKGANVDEKSKAGETALMFAVMSDEVPMAQFLISKGSDVNARNDFGETVLMRAAISAKKEMVELLIEKGAEINAKDESGRTALKCASTVIFYEEEKKNLDKREEKRREVINILREHGAKE